ncbi:MAG: ATP synthase F1 subunit delta [Acidobacteria bacterium]|nr:ATP synthase F1 subunit delta [Acidobacteriota bacterium]
MSLAVASRYARALADASFAPASPIAPGAVAGELLAFEQALDAAPDFRRVLESPAVQPARKRAVVTRIGELLGVSSLTRNFANVVLKHGRIRLWGLIRQAYERQVDERTGTVRVGVSSAFDLDAAQRGLLEGKLAAMTGKKVECQYQVDPTLLGGLSVRLGSTVYDGSVRGQLDVLRAKLAVD